MIWLWGSFGYGFVGAWMFTGIYRTGRKAHPERPRWREALECGAAALLWPLTLALIGFTFCVMWVALRGDRK